MSCFGRWLRLLLLVSPTTLSGCGQSTTPPASDTAADSSVTVPVVPPKARTESSDAAAALTAVVEGFRQNRAEVIWDFLPTSHQREINDLAREFAKRMDAELWKKTADVARDSAGLLKDRKQSFLSHPTIRDSQWGADDTLSTKWNGVVALLATVAGSELADLEQMKTFDGATFFARFDDEAVAHLRELSNLLGRDNPFSMLREMTDGAELTTLLEIDDQAVVEIRPKQGKPRRFPFRRVDGKWVPESWNEELLVDIRRAKERLNVELAPSVLELKKEIMLPYLDNAQTVLQQLKNAKSDDAFHDLITAHIIKPALQLGAADTSGGTAPIDLTGKVGDAITIIVSRRLESAELDRIADSLLETTDADLDLTSEVDKDRTTFVLSPVKDVAAFAKRIAFGIVTAVETKERTITVDVLPAPEQK